MTFYKAQRAGLRHVGTKLSDVKCLYHCKTKLIQRAQCDVSSCSV